MDNESSSGGNEGGIGVSQNGQTTGILCIWRNISNPTMRTGLDFKSAQFESEEKPSTGAKCEDLKSSPFRIGGFDFSYE